MSFHASQTFTFGETPSATKWNYLWENDYALQDWSAFTNGTFPIALIDDGDITPAKLDADAIGHGYLEIARTTLGSAGDTITLSSIPARKYLKIRAYLLATGGGIEAYMRFNNDSGSNYTHTHVVDMSGAAGSANTSSNEIRIEASPISNPIFAEIEAVNVQTHAKLLMSRQVNRGTTGAANAVGSRDLYGKWENTSAQINRIDFINAEAGDYAIGSEIIVYGTD